LELIDILEVVRARFLTLSLVLGITAGALAAYQNAFSFFRMALGMLGLFALHMAVNSLNSASDARRGIDSETSKTRFSGGIDTITEGRISYATARNIGTLLIISTVPVYSYFASFYRAEIVLIMAISAITASVGYTDLFARAGLGEIVTGLGLGSLSIITLYYFQSGHLNFTALYTSALISAPVFNLILLNEYPDIDTDRKYGRVNIPIILGKRNGVIIYSIAAIVFYSGIIIGSLYLGLPQTLLLSTLTSPLILAIIYKMMKQGYKTKERTLKYNILWAHISVLSIACSYILPLI